MRSANTFRKETLTTNELRAFRAIYESGPLSRIEVAEGLHLTRAAISNIIKRLIEMGLIQEQGKGRRQSGRGRKGILLEIHPNAGYVISLHIALNYVTYGIVNLKGEIICKNRMPFELDSSPFQVLDPLTKRIPKILNENGIESGKLLGVAVALPGIVSQQDGMVIECTLEGWEHFALRKYLEDKLHLDVILENDVKTVTLGEFHFGSAVDAKNLVCLWLEDGIGSGVIIEGRLLRGITSSAGEIGFNEFILDQSSKKSIFIDGQPRFWGNILSFTNILTTIQRGLENGWESELSTDADINEFIEAVEKSDPLALYIFRLFGKVVGKVACNLIYTFNPEVLLLIGSIFNRLPHLADEVYEQLEKGELRTPIKAADIRTSVLGEDSVTVGGAALVMEDFLKGSEQKSMRSE